MNEQNLKPWKPGQSGNPNGRPRKLPKLETLLTEVLGDGDDRPMAEVLQSLLSKAKKGDVKAAAYLMDRVYGKLKERIEIENEHAPVINWHKLSEATLKEVLNASE